MRIFAQTNDDVLYRQALDLYVDARFEHAIPLLERIRSQSKDTKLRLDASALEAICLATLGNKTRAKQIVQEIFRVNPEYRLTQEINSPWIEEFFTTTRNTMAHTDELGRWEALLTELFTNIHEHDLDKILKNLQTLTSEKWENTSIREKINKMQENVQWIETTKVLRSIPQHMVRVPGASIKLGVGTQQHQVKLTSFYMDRYPVTWEEFAQSMGERGHSQVSVPPGKSRHPVTDISWEEAQTYCQKRKGSLPTQDQWEYAARGPEGLAFPYGRSFNPQLCNVKESGIGDTTPVEKYSRGLSPFGVGDMCGNVWEWTKTQGSSSRYIVKGGSFRSKANEALTYASAQRPKGQGFPDVGFRCVLSETTVLELLNTLAQSMTALRSSS